MEDVLHSAIRLNGELQAYGSDIRIEDLLSVIQRQGEMLESIAKTLADRERNTAH